MEMVGVSRRAIRVKFCMGYAATSSGTDCSQRAITILCMKVANILGVHVRSAEDRGFIFAVQETEVYTRVVETLGLSIRMQLVVSGFRPIRNVIGCFATNATELRSELCQGCQILMRGVDSVESLLRTCASGRGWSMLIVCATFACTQYTVENIIPIPSVVTDSLRFCFGAGSTREALFGHDLRPVMNTGSRKRCKGSFQS